MVDTKRRISSNVEFGSRTDLRILARPFGVLGLEILSNVSIGHAEAARNVKIFFFNNVEFGSSTDLRTLRHH